jgi:NTE family protein
MKSSSISSFGIMQSCFKAGLLVCLTALPVYAQKSDISPPGQALSAAETGVASASAAATRRVLRRQGDRLKIGLALAGGGTRGCAHIGVLKVFKEAGIPVDCIAGTSMGAIVGGLYCAGTSLDKIEELLTDKKLLHAYDTVPIPVRVVLTPFFALPHLFGYKHFDGLYRGNVFAKFITRNAPAEHNLIESFPTPFAAVASNLLDGKAYAITSGDVGRAVQASSAIPFLRRPVEIGDKLFIDGGIVLNLPCDKARELGADFVIAVDIDDDLKVLPKKHFYKIGSALNRSLNMHLSSLDAFQLDRADFVMHPDLTGITLLDGDPAAARQAIKSGEEIARKLIPALKQKLEEHSASVSGKVNKGNDKSE